MNSEHFFQQILKIIYTFTVNLFALTNINFPVVSFTCG